MSYIINHKDKYQPRIIKSFPAEWLRKIEQNVLELIKTQLVKSTSIIKSYTQNLDLNGSRNVIEFVSIYLFIFKIFITVEFTFLIKFQIHIKYNIISPYQQIIS